MGLIKAYLDSELRWGQCWSVFNQHLYYWPTGGMCGGGSVWGWCVYVCVCVCGGGDRELMIGLDVLLTLGKLIN